MKSTIASIPGETPCTAGGVCGVGLGEGVGVGRYGGISEGVGVAVGTGDAVTGIRLAPVAKFKPAAVCEITVGKRK